MNKIARSNRREDVRSFAREHVFSLLSENQGLLERLEAENARFRRSVGELMLEIEALREALGLPQSEIRRK